MGLLLPLPLARILVLVIWVWATIFNSSIIPLPTITGTVLSPLGDYAAAGWLGADRFEPAGAAALSPATTAGTAALSIVALLGMSAVLFALARTVRAVCT